MSARFIMYLMYGTRTIHADGNRIGAANRCICEGVEPKHRWLSARGPRVRPGRDYYQTTRLPCPCIDTVYRFT